VYSTSAAADAAAADADDEDEDARAATARGRRDDDARGGAGADARTLDEHAIARDARSDRASRRASSRRLHFCCVVSGESISVERSSWVEVDFLAQFDPS
jgi:hypothetical protein